MTMTNRLAAGGRPNGSRKAAPPAAQRLQTLFADYIGRRLEGRARHGS